MRKLFRWHRGGLRESLDTTVEVNDFKEVEKLVLDMNGSGFPLGFYSNVRTEYCCDDSSRCGEEWRETYYVIADTPDFKGQAVGMSNFSSVEEKS